MKVDRRLDPSLATVNPIRGVGSRSTSNVEVVASIKIAVPQNERVTGDSSSLNKPVDSDPKVRNVEIYGVALGADLPTAALFDGDAVTPGIAGRKHTILVRP
jgi:hypothetical protein